MSDRKKKNRSKKKGEREKEEPLPDNVVTFQAFKIKKNQRKLREELRKRYRTDDDGNPAS